MTRIIIFLLLTCASYGQTTATARSSRWPAARMAHLRLEPCCAVCSSTIKLEVHHIQPFNERPDLELDPQNLITLCESKQKGITCHLLVGHLGNYQVSNPNVREDAWIWNQKLTWAANEFKRRKQKNE